MTSSRRNLQFVAAAVLGLALSLGSQSALAGEKTENQEPSANEAKEVLKTFTEDDPDLNAHLTNAAGYVVFPVVAKAGVVVGGGGGRGILFEKGVPVGEAKLTMVNVGAQIGGQRFSEVIILKDQEAMKKFKRGQFGFQAGASATAAGKGASANLNYQNGVAVMTKSVAGLMAEVTVGGQKFDYMPYGKSKPEPRT